MAKQKDPVAAARALSERLAAALGDNLVSVLLYGSAARGEYTAARSDVNVLVLLGDASTASLRSAARPLADWVRGGESPPLIFSEAEWRRSTDVFAMEIADMRDGHLVLHGDDPLAEVTTTRDDLRRQLEREVIGTVLHLRAAYAAAAPDAKALEALLTGSASHMLTLCRGLVRLSGEELPADRAGVAQRAAALAGLEPDPFEWVVAAAAGHRPRALVAHDPLAESYVAGVEQMARHVDES
jgi:predicted nucleotidyltransferase